MSYLLGIIKLKKLTYFKFHSLGNKCSTLTDDESRTDRKTLNLCLTMMITEINKDSRAGLDQSTRIFEPRHDKTNKMSVRPAKTQISLGIRPV